MSFVSLCGESKSKCGYCKASESVSLGIWALKLSAWDFQALLDAGFRRSGCYCYKPSHRRTCCESWTIRQLVSSFHLSKSQKKTIRKVAKLLNSSHITTNSLVQLISAAENNVDWVVVLEKPSFSDESFDVYCKYQVAVHHDDPDNLSQSSYTRFLVDSPVIYSPIVPSDTTTNSLPVSEYGTYHQKYYYKSKLIAVAVLDILPLCVSSVYFYHSPDFSHLSLGTYSALREIMLTQQFHSLVESLQYYYMGFYIRSCPKMVYKAAFKPSELLCPGTFTWSPLEEAVKLIDQDPKTILNDEYGNLLPEAININTVGESEPSEITQNSIIKLLHNGKTVHIEFRRLPEDFQQLFTDFVGACGSHKLLESLTFAV